MTSETNAFEHAQHLTRTIFDSAFPHSVDIPAQRMRSKPVPEELQVEPVTADTPLAEGDVLALHEPTRALGRLDHMTAREVVASYATTLVVVKSATKSTINVVYLRPRDWRTDLGDLASQACGEPFRIHRYSAKRLIGRLDTLDRIQQQVRAHHLFNEWKTAHTAALEQYEADMAERDAERASAVEAAKPVQAAADRLNGTLGANAMHVTSVFLTSSPKVRFNGQWGWLESADRAEVYLHGLAALDRIDEAALQQALKDLRTVLAVPRA